MYEYSPATCSPPEKLDAISDANNLYWHDKYHTPAARESYSKRIAQLARVQTQIRELQNA